MEKKAQGPWWESTTIYQVYPRSFQDLNGDGIGDLQGLISRLDHLQTLGIETIWLSPIYASPLKDFGYDISDYKAVAPEYGTMADFEKLLAEIHSRGMRLLMDLVLNHTSEEHPWFLESKLDQSNPKADWYIWRDGKSGGRKPPTNWESLPGGNGWKFCESRQQWYFASFLPFQPDLNYHNPEVRKAMWDVARFWLEKGVDGFRLDIFNAIIKDAQFRDNPFCWRWIPSKDGMTAAWQRRLYTVNLQGNFELAKELRAVVDAYGDKLLIGEVFGQHETLRRYLGNGKDALQLVFLFDMLFMSWNARFFRKRILEHERTYASPLRPTFVVGNHDTRRSIERLGGDLRKAKLLALMQMTTRAIPVMYYGEEVGMLEAQIPKEAAKDPLSQLHKGVPQWIRRRLPVLLNRDACRSPMQWTQGINAGFCPPKTTPWLPLAPEASSRNVENAHRDELSLLQVYRALLLLRRNSIVLRDGLLNVLSSPGGTLAYTRQLEGQTLLIALNFTENLKTISLNRPAMAPLFTINGGAQSSDRGTILLPPLSGGVWPLGA